MKPWGLLKVSYTNAGSIWRWRYMVDGVAKSQVLKDGGRKVTSQAEAKRIRQALIADYHADSATFLKESEDPTLEEFLAKFEPWSRDHERRHTTEAEKKSWEKLRTFTSVKRIGQISTADMERFKAALKSGANFENPLSESSVNHVLRHLMAIFNQGIELGLYTGKNPLDKVKLCKIPRTIPDFLTDDEVDCLLTAAEDHAQDIHWVFLLGISLGLRKNEIGHARWEWFEFDQKLVTVKASDEFQIKDSEERVVPMPDKLHAALYPHRKKSGYLSNSGRQSEAKNKYRYEPKKCFKAVAKKAGVEKATFQLLRHTFGSRLAQAGVSLYKISKWMGHSSVDVTTNHYAGLQSYDDDINKI